MCRRLTVLERLRCFWTVGVALELAGRLRRRDPTWTNLGPESEIRERLGGCARGEVAMLSDLEGVGSGADSSSTRLSSEADSTGQLNRVF